MAHRVGEGAAHPLALRAASGLTLSIVTFAAVYFGRPYFNLLIAAGAAALAWEWVRLCGERVPGFRFAILLLGVLAVAGVASVYGTRRALMLVVLSTAALYGAEWLAARARRGWLAFGALYIGLPVCAYIAIAGDPQWGRATLLWMFFVVAATDMGAYFCGTVIGGPKIAPGISPNKTWAGLIGGSAAAMAVGALTAGYWLERPVWPLIALSAALAVVSQAGDFFESLVKRKFGVKDSSAIIPGHGGLFDRVDGHIAAAASVAAANWASGSSVLTWR